MPTTTTQTTTGTHCECCGRPINPWRDASDGYTHCCNELICYGEDPGNNFADPTRWTDGTKTVEACCSAKAAPSFTATFWRQG